MHPIKVNYDCYLSKLAPQLVSNGIIHQPKQPAKQLHMAVITLRAPTCDMPGCYIVCVSICPRDKVHWINPPSLPFLPLEILLKNWMVVYNYIEVQIQHFKDRNTNKVPCAFKFPRCA